MDVSTAYEKLEKVITQGFVTEKLSVLGHDLVLKTITDKEASIVGYYTDDTDTLEVHTHQMAMSTFILDGVNVLRDRDNTLKDVARFYKGSSTVFSSIVSSAIKDLNESFMEAIKFLEGFCYTSTSRFLWRSVGEQGMYRFLSGIPGAENLGINSVQQNWAIINRQMDEEESYNREFGLSILVASAFNAKGAKVVQKGYEAQRKLLVETREAIAEYGYDKNRYEKEKEKSKWTAPLRTREDLVRELYRQMRGEKDTHDLFIEKWIDQQRKKAEEAKQQAVQRQQEYRARLEELDLTQLEGSRPVSLEEVKKAKERQRADANKYMSSTVDVGLKDRFIKKISSRVIRGSPK